MMHSGDEDFGDDITSGIGHQDEPISECGAPECPSCGCYSPRGGICIDCLVEGLEEDDVW